MSNSYTATAFVVNGPFSAETRKNPATKYLEHHCKEFFDTNHSNRGNFWTNSFSIRVPNGAHYDNSSFYSEGIEPYYMKIFSEFRHVPYHQIAIENKDGWDLYACMWIYGDVAGDPHNSETKHEDAKDPEGRQWDVRVPIYYHFELLNDESAKYGMKMNQCTLIKDTAVVNARLEKRGLGDRKPQVP